VNRVLHLFFIQFSSTFKATERRGGARRHPYPKSSQRAPGASSVYEPKTRANRLPLPRPPWPRRRPHPPAAPPPALLRSPKPASFSLKKSASFVELQPSTVCACVDSASSSIPLPPLTRFEVPAQKTV
jgi:hypothetical protein